LPQWPSGHGGRWVQMSLRGVVRGRKD